MEREQSPLLEESNDFNEPADDLKAAINPTRPLRFIILITLIEGGLQLSWSTEFSNGTPFLRSLGMSKTLMSLVWIAGPMSGTFGQPIVGVLSDELRWKIGRRRPFIVGGGLATIASLMILSWSKEIMGLFSNPDIDPEELKHKTIPLAVAFVYILDFSISAIQASARAFLVDNIPTHQQQRANAWAARMVGFGNIIGYGLGATNLPKLAPWLGDTQFKVLCVCASSALVFAVTPAVTGVRERDPNTDPTVRPLVQLPPGHNKIKQIYQDTKNAILNLSPQTRLVCNVQFFAWIGYFPMLFYTTTYVGEMYRREKLAQLPPGTVLSPDEAELLWEEATRRGTFAMVLYAITSLSSNVILPFLVRKSYHSRARDDSDEEDNSQTTTSISQHLQNIPGFSLVSKLHGSTTVARCWTFSHGIFILAMASTFFISTYRGATALIAVLGVCWAHALWAPYTLIAEEISRIKEKKVLAALNPDSSAHQLYQKYEHQAGVILGVHNVFIASPQVISSLMGSILFKIFSSQDDTKPDNSIAWVFRFGGCFALIALYLSTKLKTPEQLNAEENLES
jgi:solute carrier family 45, member 1/2/4